jgi:Domain of unknown function (DUF932)
VIVLAFGFMSACSGPVDRVAAAAEAQLRKVLLIAADDGSAAHRSAVTPVRSVCTNTQFLRPAEYARMGACACGCLY